MNRHTVEGARLIIETEKDLDVAAVVAYEHHIRIDGGGYPSMLYERACHPASALVHVCDVFDALRTNRPYRDALSTARALSIIEQGAGTDFDEDVAHAFVQMMNKWEDRIANVDPDQPDVEVLATAKSEWADVEVYDLDEEGGAAPADASIQAYTFDHDEPEAPPLDDPDEIEVYDLDGPVDEESLEIEVYDLDGLDDMDEDADDDMDWIDAE